MQLSEPDIYIGFPPALHLQRRLFRTSICSRRLTLTDSSHCISVLEILSYMMFAKFSAALILLPNFITTLRHSMLRSRREKKLFSFCNSLPLAAPGNNRRSLTVKMVKLSLYKLNTVYIIMTAFVSGFLHA